MIWNKSRSIGRLYRNIFFSEEFQFKLFFEGRSSAMNNLYLFSLMKNHLEYPICNSSFAVIIGTSTLKWKKNIKVSIIDVKDVY